MLRSFMFLMSLSFVTSLAQAAEIATVAGRPGEFLDFTKGLIQERIQVGSQSGGEISATWAYSIFARKGVKSAVSVEVLNDDGSGTTSDLLRGFRIAASKAPVVFSNIGPIKEEHCKELAAASETAFVVVSGNDSMYLDPREQPHCLARNILNVTALDQSSQELTYFANWGDPLVRVAASSSHILCRGLNGEETRISNTTAGASLVAARLAIYAREHSGLKGSALIGQFLQESTVRLPKLEGKVEGARALLDE